jgi:FixJ family two-component response regulator
MNGNESAAESLLVAIVSNDASIRNSTQRLIRSFGFEQALISAIQFALRRGR